MPQGGVDEKASQSEQAKRQGLSPGGQARLILAEKRTWLAVMRTGIALLALPMSVLGALVAFSRHYNPSEILWLLVPVLALCGLLLLAGAYLMLRAFRGMHRDDARLSRLKREHEELSRLID